MNPSELQKLPLFAGLSPEESGCLQQGEEIAVAAGEIIAGEGDPAIYFYVILEGEIRVSKTYGNQKVVMAVDTAGSSSVKCHCCWTCPISSMGKRGLHAGCCGIPRTSSGPS